MAATGQDVDRGSVPQVQHKTADYHRDLCEGSYAKEAPKDEIVHERAELAAELKLELRQEQLTLPKILRVLAKGTRDDKVSLLCQTHGSHYRKTAEEMRRLLYKSGVLNGTLALCETAAQLCDVCKRWANSQMKSAASVRICGEFNDRVLMDLIFFSDAVFMLAVDEATRATSFVY